jgi:hypothetical protein
MKKDIKINVDENIKNKIGLLKGLSKRNCSEDKFYFQLATDYINEILNNIFPNIPELTKLDSIKFIENNSTDNKYKKMIVTLAYYELLIPCIYVLEMTKDTTFEEHAVSILKKEYNIDFNIDDIKFKLDENL